MLPTHPLMPSPPSFQVELTCRVAVLLLRLHHAQLVATPSARPMLVRLRRRLRGGVQGLKDVLGFNLAALQHLQRMVKERSSVSNDEDGFFFNSSSSGGAKASKPGVLGGKSKRGGGAKR